MGKKLTQGFVEEYISSFGYTLLSEYVNGRQHLQLQCPEGHTYNSSFENFRLNGTRCPACYRERVKAKDYTSVQVCDNCGDEFVRKTKKRDNSRNSCSLQCSQELQIKDNLLRRKELEKETTICQCGCNEVMSKYRFYTFDSGRVQKYQPKCKVGHRMPMEPREYQARKMNTAHSGWFQKGHTPFSKGKTYEEMYGVERANELKEMNRQAHLGQSSYWEGKTLPKEMIEKAKATRLANGGYGRTEEQNQKLSATLQGIPYDEWEEYITPLSMRDRFSMEYKKWHKSVFERDNYTCQDCGIHNHKGLGFTVKLEAHHIQEWVNYHELRFVVSNGKTLCTECHKKYSKGAYTNNSIERNKYDKHGTS